MEEWARSRSWPFRAERAGQMGIGAYIHQAAMTASQPPAEPSILHTISVDNSLLRSPVVPKQGGTTPG